LHSNVFRPDGFDEAIESSADRPRIWGRPPVRADDFPGRMLFGWRPRTILGQFEMIERYPGLRLVDPTSVSLLDRLKAASPDAVEWQRLQEIYLPLIQRWLRRVPGLANEANDLAQEVFVVVIHELPRFERRREGSFRAWLRTITANKARNYCKRRDRRPTVGIDQAEGFLDQMADPDSDLARQWDREHDEHVVRKLLAAVEGDFKPTTWEAFRRLALDGLPAARVAESWGCPRTRSCWPSRG
jgi:RNA polymerase sigma-70 factor (ECF subfamily)